LSTRRVAHHEHGGRIAAVFGDVVVHPAQALGDVTDDVAHLEGRPEAMIGRHEYEPGVIEGLRLERYQSLVARLPAATVDPEHDRAALCAGWRVHVEHLSLMRRSRVWNVPRDDLGVGRRTAQQHDQQNEEAAHGSGG
jgi:hypothetical protein